MACLWKKEFFFGLYSLPHGRYKVLGFGGLRPPKPKTPILNSTLNIQHKILNIKFI